MSATLMAQSFTGMAAVASEPELDDRTIHFDVASQPLQTALLIYADQARVQLIVPPLGEAGRDKVAALYGDFTAGAALTRLLDRSRFGFEITGPQTIVIQHRARRSP